MTEQKSSRSAAFVLIGAALVGVIAISVFEPTSRRHATSDARPARDSAANGGPASGAAAARRFPAPDLELRLHYMSPFSEPATDSAAGRCAATVREQLLAADRDTAHVTFGAKYGVHPPPGRGPDSLIVEGTALGTDRIPAVWHCAVTRRATGEVGTLTAVIEDGWPAVIAEFEVAHPVTVAAEDACLQQTKTIYREYEFRGMKLNRVGDTLHVIGEAIPLNNEDLAGDFHCRAVVYGNQVVSAIATAGK